MKILKLFLCVWLAIMLQIFVGCSDDNPIDGDIEYEESKDGENDNEKISESVYRPYVTNKRINKLVVDHVTPNMSIPNWEDHTYYHHLFSSDGDGRIIKHTCGIFE